MPIGFVLAWILSPRAGVDGCCWLLDENGSVFSELYAIDSAAQTGVLLKGHGLHIAWAMTLGRIVGVMAASPIANPGGLCFR